MTCSMSGAMRSTAARPSSIASAARWNSMVPNPGSNGLYNTADFAFFKSR